MRKNVPGPGGWICRGVEDAGWGPGRGWERVGRGVGAVSEGWTASLPLMEALHQPLDDQRPPVHQDEEEQLEGEGDHRGW